jgi:hypothetical protein
MPVAECHTASRSHGRGAAARSRELHARHKVCRRPLHRIKNSASAGHNSPQRLHVCSGPSSVFMVIALLDAVHFPASGVGMIGSNPDEAPDITERMYRECFLRRGRVGSNPVHSGSADVGALPYRLRTRDRNSTGIVCGGARVRPRLSAGLISVSSVTSSRTRRKAARARPSTPLSAHEAE